jgi:linoleoyl-CoA desaturase
MSQIEQVLKPLKFSRAIGKDFSSTLKKRVRQHFKENNISKYGNGTMYFKTVFMISLYIVPYLLMVTGMVSNIWGILGMFVTMGFGMAGIGLSVMHDANHGAYSKNEKISKVVGRIVNLVGGFAPTWSIQHNVLHHTYTNVYGYDEDVSPAISILRFSPDDKRIPAHRFQFIYAWFFYGLMTVMWITSKDFKQLYRYKKMGLTKTENVNFAPLLIELILTKVFYYAYVFALPLIFTDVLWWQLILFVFIMHFVAGSILGAVFQPAHVVPETKFPVPKKDLTIENNWMIHQLETTTDFAMDSKIFGWYVGGLNFQVVHHLFPNICHVHYKALSKIVKETAEEFGLPYHTHKTFFNALGAHTRMLKQLGRA